MHYQGEQNLYWKTKFEQKRWFKSKKIAKKFTIEKTVSEYEQLYL